MSKREPKANGGDPPSPSPSPSRDVVFVYGKDESNGDLGVIRKRDEHVQLGRMRAMRDGEPIHGELVRLSQRPEHGQLFDVDVVHDARQADARTGPAQVSTRTYRDNWEQIFGHRAPCDGPTFDN
jgi:hypothetical protein